MAKTAMEVGADGVAVIAINNPPVNLLTIDVLISFKEITEQALQREDVKAIVIAGSKRNFSGGFDVSAFGKKGGQEKLGFWSIDFITDTLEAARKPLVAAIDGLALGGGLEIALACHARVATSSGILGLPELRYGILPGFGGTQRLPRLVGLPKALEMMLVSKLVNGVDAHISGLVDAITPASELINCAREWASDILQQRKPWSAALYKTDKLVSLAEARAILKFARTQAQNRAPNLKHPLVCIDVIEVGLVSGPRAGLWKESEALEELRQSDTCRSLVHIFFAQRGISKIPGITDLGLVPRKISKVAVVGGGLMGSGVATVLLLSNYTVILKEVNKKFLLVGLDRVKANLQHQAREGKMTNEELDRVFSLLEGVVNYEGFGDVDMVIEAVSENISVKQQVFADLENHCPENCILTSTTSTINLSRVGERTKSHHRIVGSHFLSPAHIMPLLEIVRTEKTSPQVIIELLDVCKKMKKIPIVVRSCTGFAVNRMFFPYSQVSMMLVELGADIYQIDQAIENFGMPMGPFRMIDHVGLEVAFATGIHFVESFPERSYKSMLTWLMHEDGRSGETAGKGYYMYDNQGRASPDPEIKKYVCKARCISGAGIDSELVNLSNADIVEMIFFSIVNEACRILEEGIVFKASDLDVAAVMGMEFPSYRGGIIFWANSVGATRICSKLEIWSKKYGAIFKPCTYLAARASNGISLGNPVHPKSQL